MNPQLKQTTYRNTDYLAFIRSQSCMNCHCLMAEAHHVRRIYWNSGQGHKSHDYCTIPLCSVNHCHNPETERMFDVKQRIIGYLIQYIGEKYGKRELIDILMKAIEDRR